MKNIPKQFGFSIKIHDGIVYHQMLELELVNGSKMIINPVVYGRIKGNFFLQGFLENEQEVTVDLNLVDKIEILDKVTGSKGFSIVVDEVVFVRKK